MQKFIGNTIMRSLCFGGRRNVDPVSELDVNSTTIIVAKINNQNLNVNRYGSPMSIRSTTIIDLRFSDF